ncbi:MAG: nuclear transport factor 2 family protein [Gammaproteobacteria bacterium]|nr:nuclear transport factor 2 family protein [Gammaproteobacteria bacterium]
MTAEQISAINTLQQQYIDALDQRNMQAWLALFNDDGQYRLTSQENIKQGLPLSLMLDDCHERLVDRVKFVDEVWGETVEGYQSRHMLQPVSAIRTDNGDLLARTNFTVFYTNHEGHTGLLVTGQYEDQIVLCGEEARFRAKLAVTDTAVSPRYIIYPI